MAKKAGEYVESTGKRKSAVARVRLFHARGKDKSVTLDGVTIKQGEIFVNKKPIEKIFASKAHKVRYLSPLKLVNAEGKFAISILVKGGGAEGQLEAVIHGLARALEKSDKEKIRPTLKKAGFLTRDARIRERRKVGTGGRARRKKQSPKR